MGKYDQYLIVNPVDYGKKIYYDVGYWGPNVWYKGEKDFHNNFTLMFIRVEHDLVMEDAPHEHDFDMYVWVVPLEQGNMEDLGCEVYMYYGSGEAGDEIEEKVLTKTGCFFVPKGVRHGPMGFRKVTRNVLFIHAMTAKDYYKVSVEKFRL